MLQRVAVVGPGSAGQHAAYGVDGGFAGLVAIGVRMDEQACAVVGLEIGLVLRGRGDPDAVGRAVVVTGPAQARRKALDGAVQHHLDQAVAQAVGVARHERAHMLGTGLGAMRAVKRLEGGQDADGHLVIGQRGLQHAAVLLAQPVDQVGGRGHALAAGQAGEGAHASLGHGRQQAGVADLAQHQEHGGRLLQLARGLAGQGVAGRKAHHALDLVVARDLGQAQHGAVDVHQMAIGVRDHDGTASCGPVQVLHRHTLAAEVDGIEPPGDQRLAGRQALRIHARRHLGQAVHHGIHGAQAGPG
ncbi:conserved hypothetical protein, partial [Ricinus communis]